MKRLTLVLVLCLIALSLAACVPGPNVMVDEPNDEGDVAGFWRGLWQGIISPITFVISLFTRNVHFYEAHNNGNWYNFGFVLGAGILTGGGFLGSRKKRRND